jgi:predicted component of type VI protein secretion system
MVDSIWHKLSRVRPPRVQITYDVEIGGAIVMKQLPFVMGIIGDFTSKRVIDLPPLKERITLPLAEVKQSTSHRFTISTVPTPMLDFLRFCLIF